jgi:hypothetical protein
MYTASRTDVEQGRALQCWELQTGRYLCNAWCSNGQQLKHTSVASSQVEEGMMGDSIVEICPREG